MSTKILNIDSSDTLDEILEAIKNNDSEEFVFVVPYKFKPFDENGLTEIQQILVEDGKSGTIMSGDPDLISVAEELGFNVVESSRGTGKNRNTAETNLDENIDSYPEEELENVTETEHTHQNDELEDKDDFLPISDENELDTAYQNMNSSTDYDKIIAKEEIHKLDPNFFSFQPVKDNSSEEDYAVELATIRNSQKPSMGDIVYQAQEERKNIRVKADREKERDVKIDIQENSRDAHLPGNKLADYYSDDKISTEQQSTIEKLFGKSEHKSIQSSNIPDKNPKKTKSRYYIAIAVVVVLVGFFFFYSTHGTVKVIIEPQTSTISFSIPVVASSNTTTPDYQNGILVSRPISAEKSFATEIKASGSKNVSEKSKGKLNIINTYSGSSRALVATTRFETKSGLIFRIDKPVTVPGAQIKDGKIVSPGEIEAEVTADKPGEEYNIGPADFTIPGFKGSDKFNGFKAVSKEPMSGGFVGERPVIAENDLASVQGELAKNGNASLSDEIKKNVRDTDILVDGSVNTSTTFTQSQKSSEVATLTMTSKASAFTLEKDQIVKLIEQYLNKNTDKKNIKIEQNDTLKISFEDVQKSGDGKLKMNLKISGVVYSAIDPVETVNKIKGQKTDDVKKYFSSQSDIGSVKVLLSPFWLNRVPENITNQNIEIRLP